LKDTASELRISLELVINTELKMQLLSYGDQVKVIKPKKLGDEIKKVAEGILKQYRGTSAGDERRR
jgi:predicted DNA-binding transcriptional regulator YafY